jgi:hypothetical protein
VEEQTAAIVLLEKERDKLIEQAEQDHSDRIFAINKELADKKAGLDAETAEAKQAQLERELQEFQQVAGAMQGLISAISNAQNSATENELNQLELALERGEITREEYDRKRKEAMRKNAEAQKQAAILAATVNLASAVVAALGTPPVGPFSIAMAALIGAAGLIEIGSIIATPVPQFAKGVVGLQGEGTATSDSIHAKLSKGESVITAKETSKHKGLLEAMNKGLAEKYILSNYVKPALDSVMLSGMSDIGKSAELNGLTANLKDHNIIAAMDRHRAADVAGFKMLAKELKGNKFNARKTW